MRDLRGSHAPLPHGFARPAQQRRPRDEAHPLLTIDAAASDTLPHLFGNLGGAVGVVLAVSGGPDSIALMHLAAVWRPAGLPMWVASVDHGLRPDARRDADAVVTAAARIGLDGTVLTWDGPKPERGLQAQARAARYALLFDFARRIGASHVVTAHTLEDQAETLLMRMAAGSGLTGLAGMRPLSRRGDLILSRPFLGTSKATLLALCREHGWAFVEDPANHNTRFERARWRQFAPALAAEGLTAARLGHLAARLARADAALTLSAAAAARECARDTIANARRFAPDLLGHPDEIVLRVLAEALASLGPHASARLDRLERLLGALRDARAEGRRLRRTLQGCTVTLGPGGDLLLCPEAPRHWGSGHARRAAEPSSNVSVLLNANK